jgi:hypothetical protein
MPYCTAPDVASLSSTWTNNGTFDTSTEPNLAEVNAWIEQVSDMYDLALANAYFIVPVVVPKALSVLKMQSASIAADLAHASHSTGRFFTDKVLERGLSPMIMVRQEINAWVEANATGLENLGVPRSKNTRIATIGIIGSNWG